jgi:hypothetical protein
MASVTYLVFLDRSLYFFFQVAPQLFSQIWVNLVPHPLLPRKSGSAGNWTRIFGSVARNSDRQTTEAGKATQALMSTFTGQFHWVLVDCVHEYILLNQSTKSLNTCKLTPWSWVVRERPAVVQLCEQIFNYCTCEICGCHFSEHSCYSHLVCDIVQDINAIFSNMEIIR